jgi:hypothetical protein
MDYLGTRVPCPHPNAQTGKSGEPWEQTAGGGHCPQTGGARLAQAAGRSGHSLVQQHPPCREGGDAHILLYERSDSQATSAAIDEVVAAVRNDRPLAR